MSKTDILEQLPKLKPEERQEIRAKLNELDGPRDDAGTDVELSDAEKSILDRELEEYEKNPHAGRPWEEIEARIREQPDK